MKVYVKTAGFHLDKLTKRQKNGWYELETGEQTEIRDVLAELGVENENGITFMLNGNHAEEDAILREADEILLLRMLYGG